MQTRAIVLSRENFGEADRYVQFLTKDWGVITTLAKAARKSKRRYAGGLDLFCHNEIFLRGDPRERPYLVELTVLNSFEGIRDNLDKLFVAGKLLQWVRKLANTTNPMPSIYSLLGQSLSLLSQETDPHKLELLNLVFKIKLLGSLGLKPRIESCVQCSSEAKDSAFFDVDSGGVLCRNCARQSIRAIPLTHQERQLLGQLGDFRLTTWGQMTLADDVTHHLAQITTEFGAYHGHVRLPI